MSIHRLKVTDVLARLSVTNYIDSNMVITVLTSGLTTGAWEPGYAPQPQSDIPWQSIVHWRALGPLPNGAVGWVDLAIIGLDPTPARFTFEATVTERQASFDGHVAIVGRPWMGTWNGQRVSLSVSAVSNQMGADLVVGNNQPELGELPRKGECS